MRLASLAPWTLTERRAAALEIIYAEGPMTPTNFAKLMWNGKVDAKRFARYFLSSLVKVGLLEHICAGKEGECYRLTGEGIRLVQAPPWECAYCGDSIFPKREGTTLVKTPCGMCQSEHDPCFRCVKKYTVAVGEFPHYRMALNRCPKGQKA